MVSRTVALDVDTGIDDALAILYALAHPDLAVTAITGVCGNVGLGQVMVNTCQILSVAGARAVPVAAGADASLRGNGPRPGHRHGLNGLGDLELPPPVRRPDPLGAVELLRKHLVNSREPMTIAALAPQTNLATLLAKYPDLADRIERIVFVGGGVTQTTPALPEFNVGHDPEAAAAVLDGCVPITMYGLDVFDQIAVDEPAARRLAEHSHPAVRLAGRLLLVQRGRLIGDAGALVLLTHPEYFETRALPIRVGLTGPERGHTVVDSTAREIDVVLAVDAVPTAQAFISTINAYAA